MPVTFFAHQAPVLPLARTWPDRMDGIAIVVGSMAPDLAYFLKDSRFNVWAHAFPALALFCVPVTLVVAWLIARAISPVLWDHLPSAGPFRVHDYRGMTIHRFRWGWAALAALIGAMSHVFLDHFTHDWGWFAHHVSWSQTIVFEGVGRQWRLFRVVQYVGHVVGTALCLWLLARYGRQRWMEATAAQVEPFPVTRRSRTLLAAGASVGVAAGVAWVAIDPAGTATSIIRVAGLLFAALVVTCAALQRGRPRPEPQSRTTIASAISANSESDDAIDTSRRRRM